MNQPPTDQEFPTGDFSKGHLAAFEKIYALYHPGVLRFARELVQEPAISATIVTDSFLKLWIQHADTGGPENIAAFLHIGVQRSCFSYLKQVEQLTPAELKKMLSFLAAAGEAAEKSAVDMKAIISGWFNQLPSPAAETARLAYEEGLDDTQIAARLSMAVDEVKNQKVKAMLLIKEQWFGKTEKELAAFRKQLQKARE